jgi:hypothetical protein
MPVKSITAALTFFLSLPFVCQTFTLTYGFPNVTPSTGSVDPGPAPSFPGLSLHTFTASGVSANPTASGRFSFTGWPAGAQNGVDTYSTFTGALSPTAYLEVSLEPSIGYSLQLDGVRFDVRRSASGPRMYALRSGLDLFTDNLSASTGTSTALSVISDDVFFWNYDSLSTSSDKKGSCVTTTATHSCITSVLALRLYVWNAEAASGSFSIDNFSIEGALTGPVTGLETSGGIHDEIPFRSASDASLYFIRSVNDFRVFDFNGRKLATYVSIEEGETIPISYTPVLMTWREGNRLHKHITSSALH